MYKLMIETGFSAAHQLRGYKGKCENLHGHNWRVQVFVTSETLNEIDLVIDFHELKQITNEIVSTLDHKMINSVFPFTEKNPSSENIAKWIFDVLKEKLKEKQNNLKVSTVTVWESSTASASYYE
ncbi:MAG: 6-carboxytetrahydropterin synthase QueD [Thermodesulfovibrionales bacterium]|nr:6-carboxytetrahydropterin synthase QueD [Thermodesulfovibrionales bacterium]